MEDERWLMMAVLDHLQKATKRDGMNSESIEEAMFAISNAYSLNMRNLATRQRYPLHNLSLVDIFKTGREQLLNDSGADGVTSRSAPSLNKTSENTTQKVDVDEGFERFIKRLKESTTLFEGLEEGGSEYERRVQRAREKYESKRDAKRRRNSCQAAIRSETERKTQAESLKSEGNAKLKEKQYEQALQLYNRCIALDGENAVYYSNRAAAYMLLHRFQDAVKDCKKAIQLDGAFMRPRERLAQAYHQLGNAADEVDALNEALVVQPGNEKLTRMLGEAQRRLDNGGAGDGGGGGGGGGDGARGTGVPSLQDMAATMGEGNFEEMISRLGRDGVSNMANMLGLNIPGEALDEVFENGGLHDMQNMIRENPEMVQQAMESMRSRGLNMPWMEGGGAHGGGDGGARPA